MSPENYRKINIIAKKSGVRKRYSVLKDFKSDCDTTLLYNRLDASVENRMEVYRRFAPDLALESIAQALDTSGVSAHDITHLLTVSCTGMWAPGLDIALVQKLGLSAHTSRSSINFMGCHAAIHGLKQAYYITQSDPNAVVVVVCVELCTLHFQNKVDDDNLRANMLFGDGAAAVIVTSDSYRSLAQIDSFASLLVPEGKDDMAWQICSTGDLPCH